MIISDDILHEKVDTYWKGISQIGAQWLSSQLVDQHGKGGSNLDTRFKSQKANELRLDTISNLAWEITKRVDYLLNIGKMNNE